MKRNSLKLNHSFDGFYDPNEFTDKKIYNKYYSSDDYLSKKNDGMRNNNKISFEKEVDEYKKKQKTNVENVQNANNKEDVVLQNINENTDSNIEQSKTKEETENKQLKAEKLIIENFNPKQIKRRFKLVEIEPYYNFRNNLTIKVQEIGGYQFYLLDVDPASKISTVKQKIQDQKGYFHERQILVYEVQKLENDQTLNYYNITEDEIMYLFLKDEDEITDYNIDNEYKTQSFKKYQYYKIENQSTGFDFNGDVSFKFIDNKFSELEQNNCQLTYNNAEKPIKWHDALIEIAETEDYLELIISVPDGKCTKLSAKIFNPTDESDNELEFQINNNDKDIKGTIVFQKQK
jgi:hypothetical protein